MSNETPKTPPKSEPNRIASVRFVESVPFMGTEASYAVVGAAHAESIAPVRMEADGSVVAIGTNQRADGLLMTRKRERVFVPWANVRGITFAE